MYEPIYLWKKTTFIASIYFNVKKTLSQAMQNDAKMLHFPRLALWIAWFVYAFIIFYFRKFVVSSFSLTLHLNQKMRYHILDRPLYNDKYSTFTLI